MNRTARITLAGECAKELARSLSDLGIDCGVESGGGGLTSAFIDGIGQGVTMRLAIGRHADARAADFVCDSVYPAACFVLSYALRTAAPMLTAEAKMFSVLANALALGPAGARVLIEGETGVGKKSLARIMHAAAGGGGEPLYVDCAAIDGADERFFRVLSEARESRGDNPRRTIILDRIVELPAADQSWLIDWMRSAVGGGSESIRFIATAGRSLIGTGRRREFLEELRGMFDATLTIPPLRRRRKDIAALARYFLRGINPAMTLDTEAIHTLQEYPFPGNVRELHNLVTRLAILRPAAAGADAPNRDSITAGDVRNQIAGVYQAAGVDSVLWKLTRERVRREIARWALASASGDQRKAAANLGVEAPALLRLTAGDSRSRRLRHRTS